MTLLYYRNSNASCFVPEQIVEYGIAEYAWNRTYGTFRDEAAFIPWDVLSHQDHREKVKTKLVITDAINVVMKSRKIEIRH
jgi:hypothetical protein